MRPTDNQKKTLFVFSFSLLKSLYWTIHQQEFTLQIVATSSSKYHSPLKTPNSILQGKSRHHQNRRRPGSIEKLRYMFLTTYALSKTKHPNIHITKHMKLRVSQKIKFNLLNIQSILNQLPLPRINFLKHP
jgi:hypothetical protein